MKITKEQYARIEKYFPVQRGNVKIDNYTFINAILYLAENGCKWGSLPAEYGKWNTKLHVVSANDKVIVEMHL